MTTMTPAENAAQPYAEEVLSGESAVVSRLRLQVKRIAPHFRTALVTGERGVGKETVAREMHRLSGASAAGPFQAMEIARFAEGNGSVELRGVLYLTGLEGLEPAAQEQLVERLRAIQREVRIIVASECELKGMLATGRMRQSLASRVGSLEIRVSSLRERIEDMEAAAAAMLKRRAAKGWLDVSALGAMKAHRWPGNLAELWAVSGALAASVGEIGAEALPEMRVPEAVDDSAARLDRVMQRHVFEVLQRCSGNKLRAAELLGISRSTLYRMLEAAGESAEG